MSEFKAITTQEELDRIIASRLERQKTSYEDKLKELDQLRNNNSKLEKENSSLQTTLKETNDKYSKYDKNIESLNQKIKGYETSNLRTKIALSKGLPFDLADRLIGEDEDTLTKDAERLAGFVEHKEPVPPLKDSEPSGGDSKDAAYRSLIEDLGNEGE